MRSRRWVVCVCAALVAGCGASAPISPPAPIETADESSDSRDQHVQPIDGGSVVVATATTPTVIGRPPDPPRCTFDPAPRFGPACHVLFPVKVTGTGDGDAPEKAFDGSACTVWNAGHSAPASVTVDLGASTDIDAFVLLPEMTPNGSVVHRIEVSDDGVTFAPSQRIEAPMQSGVEVDLRLPRREHARFVRFATDASPSWVAWRDIAVVRCDAARRQ